MGAYRSHVLKWFQPYRLGVSVCKIDSQIVNTHTVCFWTAPLALTLNCRVWRSCPEDLPGGANQKVSNQKLRNLPGLVFGPPGHPISAVASRLEMGKSWRPHLSRAYRLQPQATFFLNKSCHSYLCILQSHKKDVKFQFIVLLPSSQDG